jgi:hypothetical protein
MNKLYLRLVTLTFPLASFFSSCECSETTENRLLIFLDQTDNNIFHSVKDDVSATIAKLSKKMFACLECQGGYLRIVRVVDNCQNRPILEESYQPLEQDVNPADILPTDYQKFLHSAKNYSVSIAQDSTVAGFRNTCLYEPICKELTRLVKRDENAPPGQFTRVVIYSDLLEHTSDTSTDLYKQDSLNSNEFEARLKKRYNIELPNLAGIEIHIITFTSLKTQDRIRYAGGLWKEMLESHGAKVDGPKPNY